MTVFEQVKSAINMKTVAEGYGLHIDRGGMVLCPFHNEKTPSAKIYGDNFHCFGCGEHHDIVGFTQKLFQLYKPIDAVKKLNTDFGLNIDIETVPTKADISEYQKRVNEQKAYREYEKNAWQILCDYLWLMREWKKIIPVSPEDDLDERFIYALHHFDYAEYLCDEFFKSDKNGRADMENRVSEIADFLSRLS